MEKDKQKTHQKILQVAREEFLAKGYEKASLRKIAQRVGISATAIYRHFKDKEELFSALVEPDLHGMLSTHAKHDEEVFNLLKSENPSDLWRLSEFEFMETLDYVYERYDSFKLLLCCAEGTRLHDFQHELVNEEVKSLLAICQFAKSHGVPVNPVGEAELHLIMSGFFSSIFEMVVHDYSKEKAMKCGKALAKFFNSGISTVLGF
ncbi:MAG: TetR/AcrR family transcriptional regulator [Lachnospiraceae bacterium]